MAIIKKIPSGTTWKEFREQYARFFPVSHEAKRLAIMGAKYTELTGRPAEDPKEKKIIVKSQSRRYEQRNSESRPDVNSESIN